jgi:hypothetical protein
VGRENASLRRLINLENVPLSKRFHQLAIAAATPLLCRPLHITHVLEHPKCGGSWVRDSILSYLGKQQTLDERFVSRNNVFHGHRLYRRSFRWPIIVVRDPRDMYVSLYHHEISLTEEDRKPRDIDAYFRSDPNRSLRDDFAAYLEVRLTIRLHPWFFFSELLDSWINRPRVCVVRFEDMLADPEAELAKIIRFTGRPVDLRRIRQATEENSFAHQTRLRYGVARAPGERDDTKFLRKGVAGDWKNHFNETSCGLIWKLEGSSLKRLGYESDSSWIDEFLRELKHSGTEPAPHGPPGAEASATTP